MRISIPAAFSGGTPLIEHLQEPLVQALELCRTSNESQQYLSSRILEIWNLEQANNSSLRTLLSQTEKLAAANLTNTTDDPASYLFTGDNFDGDGQIDKNSTVFIDREAGYIVLPIESIESLNPYIQEVQILKDSEGRPGDLAVVRALTFSSNGTPEPQIATDPHSRIEEVLDSRPDTWFTWEQLFVPRVQKSKKVGPQNALLGNPNGHEQDLIKNTGGFGLKWSGTIPGQGTVEQSVYTFTGNKTQTSQRTKLVLEFTFTDPVPLSSIRVTPFIEASLNNPRVESITIQAANGSTVRPPGLPRNITSLSGRDVTIQKGSKSLGRADYNGSGIFPVRSGISGAKTVRLELTAVSSPVTYGFAHSFYVKNTETKEQAHILGIRIKNRTSRGQERIDGPGSWDQKDFQTTGPNIFTGPVNSLIRTAQSYQEAKAKANNKSINPYYTSNFDVRNPTFNTGNKGLDNVLTSTVSGQLGNARNDQNGLGGFVSAVQASAQANTSLGQAFGKAGGLVAGPLGILVGAALSGNLYKSSKTTRTLSEEAGVDIFSGERAAIMLRDITFDSRVYGTHGELFSEKLLFGGLARAVAVYIQLEIPADWPAGPWVTCQIKPIVEGKDTEWTNIKPSGTPWTEDPAPSVITFPYTFDKIQIHFSLSRPEGEGYQNESPVFTSYAIKGLPT